MLTRQHFQAGAEIVSNTREGNWTNEPPSWATESGATWHEDQRANYVRAVHTAEAFIVLFSRSNPRFDQQKFLKACGLGDEEPTATHPRGVGTTNGQACSANAERAPDSGQQPRHRPQWQDHLGEEGVGPGRHRFCTKRGRV